MPKIDGKPIVGNHGVQNVLLRLGLNTFGNRKKFAKKVKNLSIEDALRVAKDKREIEKKPRPAYVHKELTPQKRLEMIERVVKYGDKVSKVCIDFHISRPAFYKWLKRYQTAPEDRKLEALQDKVAKVKQYYQQTPEKYEQAVLSIVGQYPQLGVKKIVQALPQIAGKPIVGHHGVQNILRRHSLNTYEKRLAYARVQVTPVIRLIYNLEQLGTRFISLPIKARTQVIKFTSVTFITAVATVILLGFLGYLNTIAAGATFTSQIGFGFVSVALLVGSIFFAYSMKYYLILAIVLSFSRQSLEEGGGYAIGFNGKLNNNRKNGNGGSWLQRIFGLGNGNGEGREVIPAGGLQPSLDHIKLKRYPFVSIHLPFYNEKKVAERILEACTSMDYPNFEIIVCDDSNDETVEIVQRYAKKHNQAHPKGPEIKILHRPTREGFKGGALKYAVKRMDPKTEFCVVFDADFIPYPDTLELFVKYFKANNNGSEDYTKTNIAVVGGYQWHVLNKSENWITRGVRTEYAGSYVIERPGREIMGLLKQISGSVYMIRADVLKKIGWGTSITEDFQLTLNLYEQGYKVIYTPYVQAPAECVSTLKRLIRQRMRWSEGHSNCIKKMFFKLMTSSNLSFLEKLEVIYISPYYLQAFFFIVGTFAWLLAETVFRVRLPFWTSLWGWSLVLTNFFSLPLLNAVGLFLEESEEKDYLGLLSFIALSYIMVPFQAYASIKGFLEKEEGHWFRTPKTGKITDIFTRGKFYRWISGILPGRRGVPAVATVQADERNVWLNNPHVALATANNQFNNFKIRPKRMRWVSKAVLVVLLIFSTTLFTISHNVSVVQATPITETLYIERTASSVLYLTTSYQLVESSTQACDTSGTSVKTGKKVQWTQFRPGTQNLSSATPCPASATGTGWIYDTPFDTNGKLDEDFTIYYYDNDTADNIGGIRACFYRVEVSDVDGSLGTSYLFPTGNLDSADMWDLGNTNLTAGFTDPCGDGCTFTEAQKYLYVDFYINSDGSGGAPTGTMYFGTGQCGANYPAIVIDSFVIPERIILIAIMAPFIPVMVLWLKKRKRGLVFINS